MSWEIIFEPEQLLAMYGNGLAHHLIAAAVQPGIGAVLAVAWAPSALTSGPWVLAKAGRQLYLFCARHAAAHSGVLDLLRPGAARLDSRALGCRLALDALLKSPSSGALLAFALNTGGYTAEMLAGAIRETDPGEVEAAAPWAWAAGRSWRASCRPAPSAAPCRPYSNEAVMMLHSTSLASTRPGATDITAVLPAKSTPDYYLPFEAYLAAAVLYLCVTFALIGFFRLLENAIWPTWPHAAN